MSIRLLHTKRWSSRDQQCWKAEFPAAAQPAVGGPGRVPALSDYRHSEKAGSTTGVQLYYSVSFRTPPSVKKIQISFRIDTPFQFELITDEIANAFM